jgi:putative transposase
MPRKPRILEPNLVYHVFNRRTDRQLLFPSPRALDDFVHLLERGRDRYGVTICMYCVMDTHWHQGIWIRDADSATAVTKYLRWLSTCHAIRFRIRSSTRGDGHVYQDRYKSKPVFDEGHYLILNRYIEANPLAAGLVERAEHWPWSSLADRLTGRRRVVEDGPVGLPPNWCDIVNERSQFDDYLALA